MACVELVLNIKGFAVITPRPGFEPASFAAGAWRILGAGDPEAVRTWRYRWMGRVFDPKTGQMTKPRRPE